MSNTDPMFDESDLDEPSYYCRHGRFIGNPYGADYMCGFCEDGVTDEEYAEYCEGVRLRRLAEMANANFFGEGVWPTYLTIRSWRGMDEAQVWLNAELEEAKLSGRGMERYLVDTFSENELAAWT